MTIPAAELETHFREVWAPRTATTDVLHSRKQAPTGVLTENFSPGEVLDRLRRFENAAPGEDTPTYWHCKTIDEEAKLLSLAFNVCLKYRRTPTSWRSSRTNLICKKGDAMDPSNWRPISLGRTVASLRGVLGKSRSEMGYKTQRALPLPEEVTTF